MAKTTGETNKFLAGDQTTAAFRGRVKRLVGVATKFTEFDNDRFHVPSQTDSILQVILKENDQLHSFLHQQHGKQFLYSFFQFVDDELSYS